MANMIDLDSRRELSYYSDFEKRSLKVLELMESVFSPPPLQSFELRYTRKDAIGPGGFFLNNKYS